MDDQNEALNTEAEETAQPESPAEEQTTDDQTVVSTDQPEAPKKKGAQSRIRELNSEVHSLRDRIEELTSPVRPSSPQLPQYPQQEQPIVAPGEEIDPIEFERRLRQKVLQETSQMVDFQTKRNATIERINREAAEVVQDFKELDPDSDDFDPELNDAIYEAVEAKVKADPTASVKQFVKKQMKLYNREASREKAQTDAEIAKQSAQSAIRPSQNKPVDTKFEDLSIDEMRNRLGYVE